MFSFGSVDVLSSADASLSAWWLWGLSPASSPKLDRQHAGRENHSAGACIVV